MACGATPTRASSTANHPRSTLITWQPLPRRTASGGRGWDRDRRAAYANNLGDTRTLIAVSATANRAKGNQGPEKWLPPVAAYQCRYAADWVAVKARWSLSMDERERVTG